LALNISVVLIVALVLTSCKEAPTTPSPVGAAAETSYHLAASATAVDRGQRFSVSWTIPVSWSSLDWIGLFRVEDPNRAWENRWWQYTNGATSGTLSLDAPSQPGDYHFRFFADNSEVDIARSAVVTVR
jgi:hypothetical protein